MNKKFFYFILTVVLLSVFVSAQAQGLYSKVEWDNNDSELVVSSGDAIIGYSESGSVQKMASAVAEDGSTIIEHSVRADASVYLLDDQKTLRIVHGNRDRASLEILTDGVILQACISPDAESLLVCYQDQIRADVFSIKDGRLIQSYEGFETAAPVYETNWSPDGKYLLWKSRGVLQTQNVSSGEFSEKISLWDFPMAFTMDPESTLYAVAIASMDQNGTILDLISVESGEEIMQIPVGNALIQELEFSPDGSTLYAVTQDSLLHISAADGKLLQTDVIVQNHNSEDGAGIRSFSLSADGRKAAALLTDGTISILYFPSVVSRD